MCVWGGGGGDLIANVGSGIKYAIVLILRLIKLLNSFISEQFETPILKEKENRRRIVRGKDNGERYREKEYEPLLYNGWIFNRKI